ncbi:MAG: maleylacetoacetate isomerase [Litorimonas sp.]
MKFYGYWRSSTSYRIRIALNLKGAEHDYVPVNLKEGEHKGEAYKAINPHGTVPLLDTGDTTLTQSMAILDWLDATYPEPAFLPAKGEGLCRDLYYAVATEIHAPNNLAVLKYLRSEFSADQAAIEAWYATWIAKTFVPVEARLAAHDWASDDLPFGEPTLFEIVLIPQVYNARRWNTDLSAFPLIEKIDAHCATLEAFDRARPENQIDAT